MDEEDDGCPPVKEETNCPPPEEHYCPPQDIDPCKFTEETGKKKKKKGKGNECEEEKTCANTPVTPDQRERLKKEHLELCKAAKQPTCGQTAAKAKKSKDACEDD